MDAGLTDDDNLAGLYGAKGFEDCGDASRQIRSDDVGRGFAFMIREQMPQTMRHAFVEQNSR